MSVVHAQAPGLVDRGQAVKQRIVQRTADRILGLEVDVTADRVEVRGRAASYYLKQLAIKGVLEEVGSWGNTQQVVIDVRIVVRPAGSDAVASE
jgi:hypothetical protein